MLVPTCGSDLFDHEHVQSARPRPLHTDGVDPGDRVQCPVNRIEIDRQQSSAPYSLLDDALDIPGCDVLEATGHRNSLNRLVQAPQNYGGCGTDTEHSP